MNFQRVFIWTCFHTRILRPTVSKWQECKCSDSNACCDWLDANHAASAYNGLCSIRSSSQCSTV